MVSNNNTHCRILFIHGLESGPNGSKARYLTQHFGKEITIIPDMEMSVFNIFRRNSIIRRGSFTSSMESCIDIIMQTIEKEKLGTNNNEYIMIGSSWGGAVALHVLKRLDKNNQPIKTVLIAPALSINSVFASRFYPTFYSEYLPGSQRDLNTRPIPDADDITAEDNACTTGTRNEESMLIFHGTSDDTIPIQSSRDFASKFSQHVKLVEVGDGDHRLNKYLLEPTTQHPSGRLKSILVEAGALCH